MKATSHGFTILELLITMAIVGIIAAAGIPAYTDYVIRSKISEATSALSDGRVKMEQFFQDNRTYAGGPVPAATTYFTYARSNDTTTTYTLTATGRAGMEAWAFTIDQDNARKTTAAKSGWNAGGLPTSCWITTKRAC